MNHNVPIQSLIDHIKTAIDVDQWAKEMAEELLKKQEPRLITYDEIDQYEVLYLEVRDVDGESGLAPWVKTSNGLWFSPLECSEFVREMRLLKRDEYNVIGRCWTGRPTDEQRQAVKWDVSN